MSEIIIKETNSLGSYAEYEFLELFTSVFGPDKTKYFSVQHPFLDIYDNKRYIDFAIKSKNTNIAIEIDGESYHNPKLVSENKYSDDLLKQNSLIFKGWKLYKWSFKDIKNNPEKVKDELRLFLDEVDEFKSIVSEYGIIELMEHQQKAMDNLSNLRKEGKKIALLNHATGTGKTYTAVMDAKSLGYKTLFIAHRKEIVYQAKKSFEKLWPEKTVGLYMGNKKDNAHIICATIQSIYNNLDNFDKNQFGYIIIDEAHHSVSNSYIEILEYFNPKFTLGLTATIERMDGKNLLDVFETIGHKLDLKTAIELGHLVPIRCIRVNTNIDISDVRVNGIKYNIQDLESRLFLEERNKLIVETYLKFVKNKKTVIFCASVSHAEKIAYLLKHEGIEAEAVSGALKDEDRKEILKSYEHGSIDVLCACDILNEGWDSPVTSVLFMARPTMSKALYIQQLGRGLRTYKGKDYLMVFDFIDMSNMFNIPYSVHRIFNKSKYVEGGYVAAPKSLMVKEKDLIYRGEKPEAYIDFPIRIQDYELVELFDWQEEVEDMISEIEFVKRVSVQAATVKKYIKEGRIKPDLQVPMSNRKFNYFKEDRVDYYANKFGWEIITPKNIKDKFIEFIDRMDMSYSYKPVFIKGFIEHMDDTGKVKIDDLVDYFIDYYETRRLKGLVVEKRRCLYTREKRDGKRYTDGEVRQNILSNPFRTFEEMNFISHYKELGYLKLNGHIFKNLKDSDIRFINGRADNKLKEYFTI